ncbi:MAG: RagB/SusD family nutrient uptake outer membrane protein [Pseudoflavonifractor sp.]|nr:RagB/SusD family nutrient uptake outer membrane protein [Alloprevotella sp.]MCM1117302.1 RagB/SusD family nutrient uptake outer membrane protein [Pseudoflavonifractor sp.]
MKKAKYIFLAAAAALALGQTSCDVERLPYGSMSSEQIKQNPDDYLDALMNGAYAQLGSWSDPMHRCGEYAGDNVAIRGYSTDAFFEFISFARTPNNYRLDQFWNSGYKAIAQTSNIINMFEEGQSASIDQALGECYYMRGMLYFYFVRAYGRPYYQAPDRNLGVPVVNGTPDNILSNDFFLSDRKTVKENYELIIADLEKAAQLMTEDKGASRPSVGAANALLSRVYLYMSGTFENPNREYAQKAVEYADKVINSGNYALRSHDNIMEYIKPAPEANPEAIFAVKRLASEFAGYDHYYGVGGMYANIGGMGWGEMYASQKYIDLLDETGRNDWRTSTFSDARAAYIEPTYEDKEVVRFTFTNASGDVNYAQLGFTANADGTLTATDANGSYTCKPVNAEQQVYTINYNGQECRAVIDNYITLNRANPQFYINKQSRETEDSHLFSPMISRLGEIYLNRAEAYAKLGQYSQALADLNTVRTRAIPNGAYDSLDASNAAERIEKERTLELAFEAERSYDVFRNGGRLTRHYPGAHTQSIEVEATDYRVVYYIPQNAINAYPGQITQNPTSQAGVVL